MLLQERGDASLDEEENGNSSSRDHASSERQDGLNNSRHQTTREMQHELGPSRRFSSRVTMDTIRLLLFEALANVYTYLTIAVIHEQDTQHVQ